MQTLLYVASLSFMLLFWLQSFDPHPFQRFHLYSPEKELTKDGQDEPMQRTEKELQKLIDPPSH